MKRTILLTLVSILTTIQATAQSVANGYYRVQNNASSRYITVKDNAVGQIDYSSTNVDLSNIVTWRGFDYVKSNPASIIYVEQHGTKYDLKVQGTGIYEITGGRTYLDLLPRDGGTYLLSVTYGGFTGRLYDSTEDEDEGYVKRTGNQAYMYWKFIPVDTDNNYLGLQPTVQVGDSYYGTLYASYPFKVASEGISVYVVDGVKDGVFRLQEITDAVKPAATPLVFKCNSNNPAQNKIMPVTETTTAPDNNQLNGTYFASNIEDHEVYVRYNENTMRVLGKNDAGELAFVKASTDYLTNKRYIPMNTCWLNVPTGLTGDFKYVSREDYATGIHDIKADSRANSTDDAIYTLTGTRANDKNLRPGIYIQNGKKLVIK